MKMSSETARIWVNTVTHKAGFGDQLKGHLISLINCNDTVFLRITLNHVSIPPNQNGTLAEVDRLTKRLLSAEAVRLVRLSTGCQR